MKEAIRTLTSCDLGTMGTPRGSIQPNLGQQLGSLLDGAAFELSHEERIKVNHPRRWKWPFQTEHLQKPVFSITGVLGWYILFSFNRAKCEHRKAVVKRRMESYMGAVMKG